MIHKTSTVLLCVYSGKQRDGFMSAFVFVVLGVLLTGWLLLIYAVLSLGSQADEDQDALWVDRDRSRSLNS